MVFTFLNGGFTMGNSKTKISKRVWSALIIFGLFGQLAWVVENMYFNVFLYNTISDDPKYIADMVAASAVTATLTTLLMGAFSDKIGKRKHFIVYGYIIWGVVTASFAFISTSETQKLFHTANAVSATAIIVIVMDCIMTFFGSTANDAAFNAWVTDVTSVSNRGKTETVLSIMPLLAMLIIFGGLDGLTQQGNWKAFFLIIGGLVVAGGIVGLFLIKDDKDLKPSNQNYFKNIVYGFKFSTVKNNKYLYISLCALCVLSVAYQVFMPYLIIYIQRYLGIDNYALILGVVLIVSSVASVLFGKLIDKYGKQNFLIPCLVVLVIGFVGVYFSRNAWLLAVTGTVMLGTNLIITSAVNGIIRDEIPRDKVGHFQGIKMIFAVLIPMVTGPYIGAYVIKDSNQTYIDLGVTKQVPTPNIFIAAAIVSVFAIVPIIFMVKKRKREN